MNAMYRILLFGIILSFLLMSGCAHTAKKSQAPSLTWAEQDLGSFPYHPLVYHLDLSILTYQLYSQSLVWPFDPYYEEMKKDRSEFIKKVKAWAKQKGSEQDDKAPVLDSYRGPGVLNGFENNARHDPILYNYARIHPWGSSITNALGRWTEYLTPTELTGKIKDVYVSYRKAGSLMGTLSLDRIVPKRNDSTPDAKDVLLAFEGGTGDKGEVNQPASQSLMGFVLLRTKPNEHYDIHIAFRGSRSGSGARAMRQAFSDDNAGGNPDWITDMGYDRVVPGEGAEHVTTISAVSRGMARSIKSILPQVFNCLKKVADIRQGAKPDNIYVTGHSLGGALGQHFVSAILLGNLYGPKASGDAMPATLTSWPWQQIKLITYSAPRVGDEEWAKLLTETGLESEFFSSRFNPIDGNAADPDDPTIVSRLLDDSRPVGYRVLISDDPLTSEKVPGGGKHVGKTVYVNKPSIRESFLPPDLSAHEPENVRQYLVDSFADPRTPAAAWGYIKMDDMVPDYGSAEKGSVAGLIRLANAVKKYYADKDIWFDTEAFDRDLAIRFSIYRGE
ncbi:MAG: lipase family protein [Calditrichia bacterium]